MTEQEQSNLLAKFYAELAENNKGFTYIGSGGYASPNLSSELCDYKVNPKKKIIDMSMLINSEIDCEFFDNLESGGIGVLEAIFPYGYKKRKGDTWRHCRIREGHWHHWSRGEKCPLPKGLDINVEYSHILVCGKVDYVGISWSKIKGFKINGLAEGWSYE